MDDLDESQKRAVFKGDGPTLVCAGPGSGKTRTLVQRIWFLMQRGVSPKNILAVTFTNKAAKEIKERLVKRIRYKAEGNEEKGSCLKPSTLNFLPFIGTIHSLCFELLRNEAKEPVVVDEFERFEIIKSLRSKSRIKFSAKDLQNKICNYKCRKERRLLPEIKKFIKSYDSYLKKNNLFDYEDLLVKFLDLIKANREIRKTYQKRFRHVLVDEYQDINEIQNQIIIDMAHPQNNLFVIGDADQSIYAFRGADMNIFFKFGIEFTDAQILSLKKNYRSASSILNSAQNLIKNNKRRLPVNISCVKKEDFPVQIVKCGDQKDEAKFIASEVEKAIGGTTHLHIDSGMQITDLEEFQFNDFAVLYRNNSFAKFIEPEFLHKGIPYQVIGRNNLWQRREVRDILGVLKMFILKDKPSSLNLIKSKIDLENFRKESLVKVRKIVEKSGIKKDYKKNAEALDNIEKIVSMIEDMEYSSLEEVLSRLSLISRETYIDERANCVKMMTLHQAKGLEFSHVFIAGVEEGLIPFIKEKIEKELEEERRLFYVGMTRAKYRLYLTYARKRLIWGRKEKRVSSRFLEEIGDEYIQEKEFARRLKKKEQMKFF